MLWTSCRTAYTETKMDVPCRWTSVQGQDASLREAQKGAHRDGAKDLVFVLSIHSMMESQEGLLWVKCSLRQTETQRLRLSGQDSIIRRVPLVLMGHLNGITMSTTHPCCWLQSLHVPISWGYMTFMSVLGGGKGLELGKAPWLIHTQLTSGEGNTHITLPSAVPAQAGLASI